MDFRETTRNGMDEILLDAIQQFVGGKDWSEPIDEFKRLNAYLFNSQEPLESGYSIEQYDAFLRFGELVDELLGKVIGDLGCELQTLVDALANYVNREPHNTKDDQIQKLFRLLQSFDEYESFHSMMFEYYQIPSVPADEEMACSSIEEAETVLQQVVAESLLEAHVRCTGSFSSNDAGKWYS